MTIVVPCWTFHPGEMVVLSDQMQSVHLRTSRDMTSEFVMRVNASEMLIVVSVTTTETEQLKKFSKFDDVFVCGDNKMGWIKANFLKHV